MASPTAVEVVERTIAIIPWVAHRRGGYATFDEIADRFGIAVDDAYRCLELAGMVGVYPYTPDTLIEIIVDPDGVLVRLPEYFRRPLRPSPEQTFLLLTAATVLTKADGAGRGGALHTALDKILGALGDSVPTIEVEIEPAPDEVLDAVRTAIAETRRLEIEHYSFGADEVTTRRVDPWRLQQSAGHWYLQGWCHERSDQRLFRLDRIRSVEVLTESFDPPASLPAFEVFAVDDDGDRVRLRLAPSARWVVEYYPCESVATAPDGSTDVVLAVGSTAWLERLLLRLGPEVEVLAAPDHLNGVDRSAARRLLGRYRK